MALAVSCTCTCTYCYINCCVVILWFHSCLFSFTQSPCNHDYAAVGSPRLLPTRLGASSPKIMLLIGVFCKTILNTPAVSSIKLRVDTHICKMRCTPAAHFYRCIIIKIKIPSSCEIEDFIETRLCKLCVILYYSLFEDMRLPWMLPG